MQWEILYTKRNKRHVERQDTAKLLYSLKFPTRALVDSDGEPLHKYDYYVRLRVDKPWKVPLSMVIFPELQIQMRLLTREAPTLFS